MELLGHSLKNNLSHLSSTYKILSLNPGTNPLRNQFHSVWQARQEDYEEDCSTAIYTPTGAVTLLEMGKLAKRKSIYS